MTQKNNLVSNILNTLKSKEQSKPQLVKKSREGFYTITLPAEGSGGGFVASSGGGFVASSGGGYVASSGGIPFPPIEYQAFQHDKC